MGKLALSLGKGPGKEAPVGVALVVSEVLRWKWAVRKRGAHGTEAILQGVQKRRWGRASKEGGGKPGEIRAAGPRQVLGEPGRLGGQRPCMRRGPC